MRPALYCRVLYWTNIIQQERVNLALYVYADDGPFVWRSLPDYTRAAEFSGWDAAGIAETVESMRKEIEGWSLLTRHSRWRHEMSEVKIAEPIVSITTTPIEEWADRMAKDMLPCP